MRTRIQHMHRIVRVLPPSLYLPRVHALRALTVYPPHDGERFFPVRGGSQGEFGVGVGAGGGGEGAAQIQVAGRLIAVQSVAAGRLVAVQSVAAG